MTDEFVSETVSPTNSKKHNVSLQQTPKPEHASRPVFLGKKPSSLYIFLEELTLNLRTTAVLLSRFTFLILVKSTSGWDQTENYGGFRHERSASQDQIKALASEQLVCWDSCEN